MFDQSLRAATDAQVIAAIEDWAAAEARAAASRLVAIAELVRRRCGDDDRAHWACDSWDSAAAEVSAALGIMHGRASGQMHLSQALCTRLPGVAALFMAGRLSYRIFAAIAWRTDLVRDDEAMSLIDSAIAENVGTWGPMSDYKLEQAIDMWVSRFDPGALRKTRASARSRDVQIGGRNDENGTAALFGRLFATDAERLDRRLMQMAHGVCDDDPRTIAQRRADALGALAAGSARLACACGSPHCAAAEDDGRATGIVIHVLADADAVEAQPDPVMSGEPPNSQPTAASASDSRAGIIGRRGIVPAPLLAEMIRSGAKVRHLRRPGDAAEPGYRPSAALDEFIRLRDMTCRFPNCDRPAEYCDIDHTVPWPLGPTHPSNLKCLCRKHHLLKTFWGGRGGWADRQLPDGTVIWTAPTGKEYTTTPGSRLFFPSWDPTTGPTTAAPTTAVPPPAANGKHPLARGLMMPTRRRTRAADREFRVRCERARNDLLVAERNRPPPF